MKNSIPSPKYKHAVIATDAVIFALSENNLNVLLIQMKKAPFENYWAAPGGLVGGHESLENSVVRILKEKAGITAPYIEQLYTFGDPERDVFGRVVSVAYLVPLASMETEFQTSSAYAGIRWFPIDKLPKLAYDHLDMINKAVSRLRSKLQYSNIICTFLPKYFSFSNLQNAYEIILAKKIDKRNFRKKILSLDLVKPTEKYDNSGANRPAQLFTAVSRNIQTVKVLR